MFRALKNFVKGVYSRKALKNSFIVNYYRYLQNEDEGIADIVKSQSDNVLTVVPNDAEKYFEKIGNKDTRVEQIREIRRAILEYLEERIQSQIYYDEKWTENQRKKIGKHLLPKLEEEEIPEQERSIYVISTIAFFVFCLVGVELYREKNKWINEYTDRFRSYAELMVDISTENDPSVRVSLRRLEEPLLNSLLEWQRANVYGL